MPNFAIFRADAGRTLGTGHVVRCQVLARALADLGWQCAFAVSAETLSVMPRLAGTEVRQLSGSDEPEELARLWPGGCDLLVVDHYERDAAFETACRSWARRLAAIDDLPGRPHVAPCVIDPGAGLTPAIDITRVHLAGPAFALLDPAFAGHRRRRRTPSHGAPVRRIFIAMGGGNVADITEVAVRVAANRLPEAEIDVVVGSGCDGHERLTSELAALGTRIRLHKAVAPTVIADMMKAADIGIGAAGTMTWERCCLGLASVVVVIAPNQYGNARTVAEAGAGLVVEALSEDPSHKIAEAFAKLVLDEARRSSLASAAGALCDGLGARRVAAILDCAPRTSDGLPIWFRPASEGDIERVHAWQCAPGARKFARCPDAPRLEEHRDWMRARLVDPDCLFSIVMCGNTPAGFIRMDRTDPIHTAEDAFEISILTAQSHQRRGIAAAALALSRRLAPQAELQATVLPGNDASHALFRRAGYCGDGKTTPYLSRPLLCAA